MMPGDPIFQVGDRVEDFRGTPATVINYRHVPNPNKSNRVRVSWDHHWGTAQTDNVEYYCSVFHHLNKGEIM